MTPNKAGVDLLLVEDSESDVFLTQEALKALTVEVRLHVACDGVEALAFLRREGRYGQAPRPDLILLDLNMPRKDGRELLAEVKADGTLCTIPVIVLTTSGAESDLSKAYRLHANCYITKSADFAKFKQALKAIEEFWFKIVTLPPK